MDGKAGGVAEGVESSGAGDGGDGSAGRAETGAAAWHAMSAAEALDATGSVRSGLSDDEAARRLAESGPNSLTQRPPRSVGTMVREHLVEPMALILIAAALLSIVLREYTEAIVILFIVIVDTVIGVAQEKKAADAIAALKSMTAPTARALREGEESVVPAADLVPGDVVLLDAGDIVPADLRLVDAANLQVQEASLTGESLPVEKDEDAVVPADAGVGDRTNMAYMSTIALHGTGRGVVVATGMDTQVGHIAHMLDDTDDMDTPMKRKLASVGKVLSIVGLVVAVVIFAIGMAYGRPMIPLLMTAVSLAISIIPEGLPATATIVMALGVQRMVKENALVRSLPAVETLGSASVICSDKTGTLTLNRMTVQRLATWEDVTTGQPADVGEAAGARPRQYKELVDAAALCNNAALDPDRPGEILGDPTEGALIQLAAAFGIDQDAYERAHRRLYEQPFESDRKRMTTVNDMDGRAVAYTKGAVDQMLPLCTQVLTASGPVPMEGGAREAIQAMADDMSGQALRVLGFAMRDVDSVPEEDDADLEHDMTFVGLVGMIDPPREEVKGAVATCHDAGIRVIMITGDHQITAETIARQLGIYRDGDTVVSGDQLAAMSESALDAAMETATVFARVSPNDKLRIVDSLQRTGQVVAMTGDGVNDAPALKSADIGVAMGITGTDVAKDASDIILLDDDFTTIEFAVEEGRRVYTNIQKVIQFLLSGNIAEILVLFVATLFNWNPPILAAHILLINLVTDTLPALALGVDPADPTIMKRKPVSGKSLFEAGLVRRVGAHGAVIFACAFSAYVIGLRWDDYPSAMTMCFATLAISQLFHAFNQRSNVESAFTRGQKVNPWMFVTVFGSAAIVALCLFVPPLRDFLSLVSLTGMQWGVVLGLSAMPLVAVELFKVVIRARAGK